MTKRDFDFDCRPKRNLTSATAIRLEKITICNENQKKKSLKTTSKLYRQKKKNLVLKPTSATTNQSNFNLFSARTRRTKRTDELPLRFFIANEYLLLSPLNFPPSIRPSYRLIGCNIVLYCSVCPIMFKSFSFSVLVRCQSTLFRPCQYFF